METRLTEQDSLKIINEMIEQTKNNIQKGSANTMIFAGYCVALTAILNFILMSINFVAFHPSWVWLLMLPMTIGCLMMGSKKEKNAMVKTHVDKIVSKIWFAFMISIACLLITIFSFAILFKAPIIFLLITPTILILTGLAQYITAVSIRFDLFFTGAYIFWLGALLCLVCAALNYGGLQFIILAVCMIVGFVIPGYKLNSKANQNV